MKRRRLAITTMAILFSVSAYAANPFLDASDDKPGSTKFRGTEWRDEIQEAEIPLTARVATTRVAKMPWGAIVKIEFVDVKKLAAQPAEIETEYFVVTQ